MRVHVRVCVARVFPEEEGGVAKALIDGGGGERNTARGTVPSAKLSGHRVHPGFARNARAFIAERACERRIKSWVLFATRARCDDSDRPKPSAHEHVHKVPLKKQTYQWRATHTHTQTRLLLLSIVRKKERDRRVMRDRGMAR